MAPYPSINTMDHQQIQENTDFVQSFGKYSYRVPYEADIALGPGSMKMKRDASCFPAT